MRKAAKKRLSVSIDSADTTVTVEGPGPIQWIGFAGTNALRASSRAGSRRSRKTTPDHANQKGGLFGLKTYL
jgi:hypothetical protein